MRRTYRLWAVLLSLLLLLSAFSSLAYAATEIQLVVDDDPLDPWFPPVLHRGVVMVPLDDLCAYLSVPCAREANRVFSRSSAGEEVEVVKASDRAWIGSTERRLSVGAVFLDDVVLVPAAFAAEVLGLAVSWNPTTRVISFTTREEVTNSDEKVAARNWNAELTAEAERSMGRFDSAIIGGSEVTLQLPVRSGIPVNGFVRVKGDTDQPLLKAMVQKGSLEDWQDLNVSQGTFNTRVWLSDGPGVYTVKIGKPLTDRPGFYEFVTTFEVSNSDENKVGNNIVLFRPVEGRATGSFTLEGWAGFRNLQVVINGPGAVQKVWFDCLADGNGYFKRDVPLPFGPVEHAITVYDAVPGDPTMLLRLKLAVQNSGSAYLGSGSVRLTNPTTTSVRVTDVLRLEGTSELPVLQAWLKKDGSVYYYNIQVMENHFSASIPLTKGAGKYQVEIRSPASAVRWWYQEAAFDVTFSPVAQNAEYLTPSDQVQSDDPSVKELAATLTAGLTSNTEKAKTIYQWVTNNISYDVAKSRMNRLWWQPSASLCLRTKTGVCEDYALLFAALCRAAGIPAQVITGRAPQSSSSSSSSSSSPSSTSVGHAWDAFYSGSAWVLCDPTWDAGYVDGDRFIKEPGLNWFDSPEKFTNRVAGEDQGWVKEGR